MNKKKGSIMK